MRVYIAKSNQASPGIVKLVYSYLDNLDATIVEFDPSLSKEDLKKRIVNCDMLLVIPSDIQCDGEYLCGKGVYSALKEYMNYNHSIHDGWNKNRLACVVSDCYEEDGDDDDMVFIDEVKYCKIHDETDWTYEYGLIETNEAEISLNNYIGPRKKDTFFRSEKDLKHMVEYLSPEPVKPMLAAAYSLKLI